MADEKKYFWLKLPTDFFKDRCIKKLKRVAGGSTYLVIYQKLLLLSLENAGSIYYEGIEDSFEDEMSLELDESVEDIQMTLMFLTKYNLVSKKDEYTYFMNQVPEMIGSETDSARRKRKSRSKLVTISRPNGTLSQGVTNCPSIIEIEKEKDIEKEKEKDIEKEKPEKPKNPKPKKEKPLKHNYAEFVLLTANEHQKLIDEHGEQGTLRIIDILNNYKGANGKTYKSDYMAILNWVVERYKKESVSVNGNTNNNNNTLDILKRMHQEAKEREMNNER